MSKVEPGVAPPTGAGMPLGVRLEAAELVRALNTGPFGEWVLLRDFDELGVKKLQFVNEVKRGLKDQSLTVTTRKSELGLHFKVATKRTRKGNVGVELSTLRGSATIQTDSVDPSVVEIMTGLTVQQQVDMINDALSDVTKAAANKIITPVSDYNVKAEDLADESDEYGIDDDWEDPDTYLDPNSLIIGEPSE